MRGWLLAFLFWFGLGCASQSGLSDSKSNWLRQCTSSRQCGAGLECACGVCTKACASADDCRASSGQKAVCSTTASADLQASCQPQTKSSAAQKICLLACQDSSECGAGEMCVARVCVGEPGNDASAVMSMDGSAGDATTTGDAARDASSDASQLTMDAGDAAVLTLPADAATKPPPLVEPLPRPPPSPDNDGGGALTCHKSQCPSGLVCHVDGTCQPPGTSDGNGATTLASTEAWDVLITADQQYVYGIRYVAQGSSEGSIVRWRTADGSNETLAGGQTFFFSSLSNVPTTSSGDQPTSSPLVVDGGHVYFIATTDSSELSASLFSLPVDDSAPPTRYGTAGSLLAQDASHLYFSNDGDSRVLRVDKTMLDVPSAREQVYISTSDAPGSVMGLAVNSSAIFVTEVPPEFAGFWQAAQYTVVRVDKTTNAVSTLASNDKLVTHARLSFASDDYFVMVGDEDTKTVRVDLATLEAKPLLVGAFGSLFGNNLVLGADPRLRPYPGLTVTRLRQATFTKLLADYDVLAFSLVATEGAVYVSVAVGENSFKAASLVRVTLPP